MSSLMNHLEQLCTEWLNFRGYYTRTGVRVGRRPGGGWSGELDVVGYLPGTGHFIHIECSTDAWNWELREQKFTRKFLMGRDHAPLLFAGMDLRGGLEQVLVHGFATAPHLHREVGGGRLVTSRELGAEIMNGIPNNPGKAAIPESFPLLRTFQLALACGTKPPEPTATLLKVRS